LRPLLARWHAKASISWSRIRVTLACARATLVSRRRRGPGPRAPRGAIAQPGQIGGRRPGAQAAAGRGAMGAACAAKVCTPARWSNKYAIGEDCGGGLMPCLFLVHGQRAEVLRKAGHSIWCVCCRLGWFSTVGLVTASLRRFTTFDSRWRIEILRGLYALRNIDSIMIVVATVGTDRRHGWIDCGCILEKLIIDIHAV
jgi:hypothetical protein